LELEPNAGQREQPVTFPDWQEQEEKLSKAVGAARAASAGSLLSQPIGSRATEPVQEAEAEPQC